LRLDAVADTLRPAGQPHAAMGVEQLLAPLAGHLLQVWANSVEAIEDKSKEVGGLVRRDVGLRNGVEERFGLLGRQPLGVLRRAGEGQHLRVLGQQGPLPVPLPGDEMEA
jgi:hypothetical protein